MVESVAIESWLDRNGNPCANTDSSQANLLPRETNHCQFTKFEDTSSIGSYTCDRNIQVNTVTISEYTSVCTTTLVDPTKTKLSDYDPILGVDFDVYTKGRQYLVVVDYTGTLDSALPADGDAYSSTNKVVIFSGYNKQGGSINHNDMSVKMEWMGVENLLDEIKIFGCYTQNVTTPHWPTSSVGLKVLSNNKCIFNENGRGNLNNQTLSGDTGKYYFNNSGLKHTTTWTLEKIFRYVTEWYTKSTSELIALDNRLGLNLLTYISNYIDVQYGNIATSDFANIVPYDFSLEGLGVLEAYRKIFEESKKYMMYKAYTSAGKVTLTFKIKNTDASSRGTDDIPMKLAIGALDATTDDTILVNNFDVNLNRETKNIGRVIVIGDYLCLNTLMTSCAYPAEGSKAAFSGNFSTNTESYSAISGLTTFTDRIALVLSDTQRLYDICEQFYVAVPTNSMSLTIADLTADLNTYHTATFQEAETTQIFDTLKALKINRALDQGKFTSESASIRDIGVFVAKPSDSEVRSPETLSYVYPTYSISGTEFYYITPIEDQDTEMDAKLDEKDDSRLIVYSKSLDTNTDSGRVNFYEYQYKSALLPFEVAYGFDNYSLSNPIPIWCRANVQTDYRIKGISTIATYDNNVHHTMIVYDDDFKLSLNYKDATYNGSGSFSNVTNGFVNASDSAILQKIQEKADSILDKYIAIQNSGYAELNGVQNYWKVGDWSDKFSGTGRHVITPILVNSVVFDFQEKKTTLYFGQTTAYNGDK